MDFLYRFRSLDCLLSMDDLSDDFVNPRGFDELRKQQICFAPFDELNDPTEGFLDLIWKGDEIFWTCLLRNYFLNLQDSMVTAVLLNKDEVLIDSHIRIRKSLNDLEQNFHRAEIDSLFEELLSHPSCIDLPIHLSKRRNGIKKTELIFYFSAIHRIAYNIIAKSLSIMEFPLSEDQQRPHEDGAIYQLISAANKASEQGLDIENMTSYLFDNFIDIFDQQHFITKNNSESYDENIEFLMVSFPKKYVEQLSSIVFPKWHTACFMEDCTNSSLWSHYGDNHKGICLKFKTEKRNSNYGLNLRGITGSSMKRGDVKPTYLTGDYFANFKKVNYRSSYPQIDFYSNLGTITKNNILTDWAMYKNKISEHYKSLNYDSPAWMENYWKNFYDVVCTKLLDWKQETEHRLLMNEMISDKSTIEKRLFNYDFQNLEGVIFGHRTPEKYKKIIIEIILEKCQQVGRADFSFYQAKFNNTTGKIDVLKRNLFKIKLD